MSDATWVGNEEAIEAWNGVLFERFVRFRHVVNSGLGAHGEAALGVAAAQPGEHVVDVGCGFGDTSVVLGGMVGDGGRVVGIDCAERFIESARREAAESGARNVTFEVADVETEPVEGPFDLAYARFGTMFFANPVAAMRNVRAGLRQGGRLCIVVWRHKPDNDWMHRAEVVAERFLTHPEHTNEPTCGPGPFSMANADTTSGIMLAAGFEDVALRRCDIPIEIGRDLDDAVEFALALGPAGELVRVNEELGMRERPKIAAAVAEALGEYVQPSGNVVAPASTWIVTASAP